MRPLLLSLFFIPACSNPNPMMNDAGADAPVSQCPAPTGSGTMHPASITQPETWTAAASPHVIASGTSIKSTVTLEPCAIVRIGPSIVVTVTGSIVANGEATKPVTIERLDASQAWSQIRALQGGTLRFTHTRVTGGGAPLNAPLDVAAAIDVRGPDQTQPPGELFHADHVTIQDSASQGISMREAGGFSAASTDLTISGSKNVPIRIWGSAAGGIPKGTYTGNTKDEIVIEGTGLGSISRDVTFHERGVPYRVGDSISESRLDVARTSGVATLTIEPGVKIRFKKGGGMYVQYSQNTMPATGALVAVGNAGAPIVFTSAEDTPAAGDWLGIHFNGKLDPKTRLDFVQVEYAGAETVFVGSSCKYQDNKNNAAAIRIFTQPDSAAFLTNVKVVASGRAGIDRGWLGTSNVSFLGGGNDLSGAKMCQETYPAPNGGPCPSPPPCP